MTATADSRDWDAFADLHGRAALADGEPTRWFEEIWSAGARDQIDLPWNRTAAYPPVAEFLATRGDGAGGRAVVVGTGLGADAEFVAGQGHPTTAFDISQSAIELARERHPGSPVDYRVADLLALPDDLVGAFEVVIEVFTVQALPRSLRADAIAGVRSLLASNGRALVVQFVPDSAEPDVGPPWLLDHADLDLFAADGCTWESLEQRPHPLRPDGRPVWVGVLRRA